MIQCNKSHRELRIYLTKEHFYCFCPDHLKKVLEKSGDVSYTIKSRKDSFPCEIPWCGKKLVHEVYPKNKFIVSFWQPVKRK